MNAKGDVMAINTTRFPPNIRKRIIDRFPDFDPRTVKEVEDFAKEIAREFYDMNNTLEERVKRLEDDKVTVETTRKIVSEEVKKELNDMRRNAGLPELDW